MIPKTAQFILIWVKLTKTDLQIYPSCCASHGESTLRSVRWRHVVFESRAFCFAAFVWQVTVMQYIIQNNKNHWNHIPKTPLAWKKLPKKGHFAHIGNEIKICSQNKCHHHLSNVCENSFRMFHSNWVISDYHSFVWQFEFPWLNLTNCPNKWMVIRNAPPPVLSSPPPKTSPTTTITMITVTSMINRVRVCASYEVNCQRLAHSVVAMSE